MSYEDDSCSYEPCLGNKESGKAFSDGYCMEEVRESNSEMKSASVSEEDKRIMHSVENI